MDKFPQLLEKGFELKDLLAETPDGYSQLFRGTPVGHADLFTCNRL